jgi:hypothetical protein
LSKTGAGGNPHAFALVAGTFCTALFSLPTVAILAVAEFGYRSPLLAVMLAGLWMAVAAAIGIPLVTLAAGAIGNRRENLALVAQGK